MNISITKIIVIAISLLVFVFLILLICYVYQRFRTHPRLEGESFIRRLSRSMSRRQSQPGFAISLELLPIPHELPKSTSVSNLSDAPPSYVDFKASSTDFKEPLPEPPSYDDVIHVQNDDSTESKK